MSFDKVVIIGGGVLGTQIGLMSAYTGHDTTFWLRSESSIGRTQPKIEQYRKAMMQDLEDAKKLIGNPMGGFLYPHGMIRDWSETTAESIDALLEQGKKNMEDLIHIELDLAKAMKDADIIIEAMAENPDQKIEMYQKMNGLYDEKTILCTNSSTLLPSMFAEHTGIPERYCALHFANTIWKNNTAEVMGHAKTDPEVYQKVVAFADEINMVPLQLHKEQPGYILNSMLVPFLTAGQQLWANGVADPETIDLTWRLATGAPKGPFEIIDIVGLTTVYNINQMKPESQEEGSVTWKIARLLKEKIDKGELGITAGKGFYEYNS